MVFDLRRALLKKEEVESARLMDFAFRLRARTMRLVAAHLGIAPEDLLARMVLEDDEAIRTSLDMPLAEFEACREEARVALVAERGDPTPHRLG